MSEDLVSRRTALKFAGAITLAAQGLHTFPTSAWMGQATGYGTDPDLLKRSVTWPRTLSSSLLETLAVVCDIVLPAAPPHPSARALGVHEFLDEWVSAPYPQMRSDRTVILGGLSLLESTARKNEGMEFRQIASEKQANIFDAALTGDATATFSRRVIELTCAGYYTTRAGHAALGYIGNVPIASFPAPAPGVVRHLERALSELPPSTVRMRASAANN